MVFCIKSNIHTYTVSCYAGSVGCAMVCVCLHLCEVVIMVSG